MPPSAATTASSSAARSAARRSPGTRRTAAAGAPRGRDPLRGGQCRRAARARTGASSARGAPPRTASQRRAPGLHASADAQRLAEEIAFASAGCGARGGAARLYGEVARRPGKSRPGDLDVFVIAYLSPIEDEEPFGGTAALRAAAPMLEAGDACSATSTDRARPSDIARPRKRGEDARRLRAVGRALGRADAPRSPARPGLRSGASSGSSNGSRCPASAARYELLVSLGRLGLHDLRADSLQLGTARGSGAETTLAAKRVFGIGDPLLLDRRAVALAEARVPLEALDLALQLVASARRSRRRWASEERAGEHAPPWRSDPAARADAASRNRIAGTRAHRYRHLPPRLRNGPGCATFDVHTGT